MNNIFIFKGHKYQIQNEITEPNSHTIKLTFFDNNFIITNHLVYLEDTIESDNIRDLQIIR